jgi:hypothetical protein
MVAVLDDHVVEALELRAQNLEIGVERAHGRETREFIVLSATHGGEHYDRGAIPGG